MMECIDSPTPIEDVMTSTSRVIAILALGLLAASVSPAYGRTAGEAYADGEARLAEADFRGALQSYAAAARADRSNRLYLQQYLMVRQVVALRERLDGETDTARWQRLAEPLHAFYTRQKLDGEALALAESMHARLDTATSAALLAETQLAADLNQPAAKVLGALDEKKQTPRTQVLAAIAQGRLGKSDEARALLGKIELSEKSGPGMLYAVSRARAVCGDQPQATEMLVRAFEGIAPSKLAGVKAHAQQCSDFAALASTPAFTAAMETKSKVSESSCSGGSSCSSCPMSGKCKSGGK